MIDAIELLVVALAVVSLAMLAFARAWWFERKSSALWQDAFFNSLKSVERMSYEKTTAEEKLRLVIEERDRRR